MTTKKQQREIEFLDVEMDKFMSYLFDSGIVCGTPTEPGYQDREKVDLRYLIMPDPENSTAVRLLGDSMIDLGFRSGDIVILNSARQPQNGDKVIAEIDGSCTMKQYYYDEENNQIWLIPHNKMNKFYKPICITPEMRFRVLGVVTGHFHNDTNDDVVERLDAVLSDFGIYPDDNQCVEDEAGCDFDDCIVDRQNMNQVKKVLHSLIDGKKGKAVAMVVQVAVEMKILFEPTFGQLESEFQHIGSKTGYNNYKNAYFYEKEKLAIRELLSVLKE